MSLTFFNQLMATVKDVFEILGYRNAKKIGSEIFGIAHEPSKKRFKTGGTFVMKAFIKT
jgi:hypothetical protein